MIDYFPGSSAAYLEALRSGTLLIELKKPPQYVVIAEIGGPPIGAGHRIVQRPVGIAEPSGALIIEVGESTLL
jgi:hypothetical protein